jgi:hypothetical protein
LVTESLQLLEVIVRKARAAVEAEERHAVAIADGPVPDAPATHVDVALLPRIAILESA